MIKGTVLIRRVLEEGMTTGKSPDQHDYYVKTWYDGEPEGADSISLPAGSVSYAAPEMRETVFPGMDTVTETIRIRLYQDGARKADEDITVSPGLTRLDAMVDRALQLLRVDPCFGCNVVSSAITAVERNMSIASGTPYRVAEITVRLTRRAIWG